MDPIEQFHIVNFFSLGKLGNTELAFTNSALFMLIAVFGLTFFLVAGTAGGRAVPTRLQSAAELTYEFVVNMLRSTAGSRRHAVLPVRVHDLHVRAAAQHVRADPLPLHGHQPYHHHRRARPYRLLHGSDLRADAATAFISSICSCPRACRSRSCR